ncbi:D-aminoacyl-tRNA deacylase-like isoform X2 [Dendronephthya gigantea]|uniref:D-aminoacyl-tRNA deacylase-like isoform X2 n=1 Tax=Dendronephthya gigantea TaxID=151771 RepID=UPI00106A5DF6|nr:D-aminoacyl-tRNA deacylase-like isoform X2 [Dendronephthya gigantea]
MRAIIQRVKRASVTVDGELISSIKEGLCVLVGIGVNDTKKDIEANKILKFRLFGEEDRRWRKSVMDLNYEVLCVSQFTLMCVLKGNKPDFHKAMENEKSQQFYEEFLAELKTRYQPEKIKDGKFAAYMQVEIQNDGPVTIQIDSPTTKNEVLTGDTEGKSAAKSEDN